MALCGHSPSLLHAQLTKSRVMANFTMKIVNFINTEKNFHVAQKNSSTHHLPALERSRDVGYISP